MLETKGIKFLERENKVALNVEPYQKVDGRIQNTLGENDIKQPYKLASQTKLWTFLWLANLVGICMYLDTIKIYACFE